MGKVFAAIDAQLGSWLSVQHVFFVASAPRGDAGHVNCSPRGGDSFRVLGPTTVAWLDGIGSGIETVAHLRDNGRIVLMFCAFDGAPRIVRLHGRGRAVETHDPEFATLRRSFGEAAFAVRAVITVELSRIAESCGFGVPLYDYQGERDVMAKWAEKKGEDGLIAYMRDKNAASLDALPGLRWPGPGPAT